MTSSAYLDHTVINVRFEMDAAEAAFRALGFTTTDRGYHSLGSINHLMMFGTDYLELIGLPADNAEAAAGRPDVANAPYGINGLVFKTDDAHATHARLQELGLAQDPPKSFSRPVELADGTQDAEFTTVHVRPDAFPAGRVYFCQHHTPDLVWRPEWQNHANGVTAMPEFVVVAEDHQATADRFAALLDTGVEGEDETLSVTLQGCQITVLSQNAYDDRYGALASELGDRESIFGALVMHTDSLERAADIFMDNKHIRRHYEDTSLIIRVPDFDAVIEFVS